MNNVENQKTKGLKREIKPTVMAQFGNNLGFYLPFSFSLYFTSNRQFVKHISKNYVKWAEVLVAQWQGT